MKAPTHETDTPALLSDRTVPVTASEAAAAASANFRINIPLDLTNWRALSEDVSSELLWFHQHALDAGLSWAECAKALGYDKSVVFRALKGTYEGSYDNITAAIRSYRKLMEARGTIQQNEFVPNSITKLIFAGLDYALANKSITTITGESRQGKTVSADAWQKENNHGRSVFVTAPAYGGTGGLLREICMAIGSNKNRTAVEMQQSVMRAFNPNRILIVDEAHRLLPKDQRGDSASLDLLRDIHDRAGDPADPRDKRGCALALLSTDRFNRDLLKGKYMYEQFLGRIGMPIRLPAQFVWEKSPPQKNGKGETIYLPECEIKPIVAQYIGRPTAGLVELLLDIANKPGRLGILVETLKVASRIAKKKDAKLAEEHILAAIKLRAQMQGVIQ